MNGNRIGRYQLEQCLHQGMVATVYLARDTTSGRQVVIKLLNAQHMYAPKKVERFLRDAHLGTALRHAHIVPVYETGAADGYYFIVMRYIEGGSLADLLERRGALPPHLVAQLGSQVASALDFAHQKSVIHRDVKPSNILLSPDLQTAYLADFGVARITGQRTVTERGMLVGTPEFMSPEQILGHKVDGRSDIYALGVTLYIMLSGRLPFTGRPAAILYNHVHSQPPSLRKLGGGVPRPMQRIVAKAMAKNPERRQQRASELVVGLQQANAARGSTRVMWLIIILLALILFFMAVQPVLNSGPSAGDLTPEGAIITLLEVTVTRTPTAVPAIIALVTSTIKPDSASTSTRAAHATSTVSAPATSTRRKPTATGVSSPTRPPTRVSTKAPTSSASTVTLQLPQDGANIKQDAADQIFSWTFGRELKANENFEIRFSSLASQAHQAPFGWIKESHQSVNLNNLAGSGTFEWQVAVVSGTDGKWEADVTQSARRILVWEGR